MYNAFSLELKIVDAKLEEDKLIVCLSDGRIVIYPLTGMTWITEAPKEQQQDFTVTDWEIYWNQIDDGLTLEHILSPRPCVDFRVKGAPNWEAFRKVVAAHQVSELQIEG
jgi:hypothetical protein